MSKANGYEWTKSRKDDIYERDIDEAELFYASLSKLYQPISKTAFGLTAHATIEIALSRDDDVEGKVHCAIEQAWKNIVCKFPALSAVNYIDPEASIFKKRCALDFPGSSTEMSSAVRFIDCGQTGNQFCDSDPAFEDQPILYIVTPPAKLVATGNLRKDIVLRIHHDLVDGMGALMLLHKFFQQLDNTYEKRDASKSINGNITALSPPLRVAADIPSKPTQEQMEKYDRVMRSNEVAREGVRVLSVPFMDAAVPGCSLRRDVKFSIDETSRVLSTCKKLGTTPTAAFHAAIAIAVAGLIPLHEQSVKARYISYALINLRGACRPPFNSSDHCVAVYHCISANNLCIDIELPSIAISKPEQQLQAQFASALTQSSAFYKGLTVDKNYLSIVPSLFASKIPPYDPSPTAIPEPNPSPSVSLSSIGIIDKVIAPKHGQLKVSSPWVSGAEYGTGIGCFLGTWEGQLELSAVYNESFHPEEKIAAFLESVKKILMIGLGAMTSDSEKE